MLTGEQIRAARALLRLEQAELAEMANISLPTIKRMEKCQGEVGGLAKTAEAVRRVLEQAGVEFIGEGETSLAGGVGVRLARS